MQRRITLITAAAGIALFAASCVPPDGGGDTTPPTIVKAAMQDADHDNQVDGLLLTYSEPVTHTADTDGAYPFAVTGHVVTGVRAATNSNTLLLDVKEPGQADIDERPAITYTRTTAQPVKDAAGNEATNQTYGPGIDVRALDNDTDGYVPWAGDCNDDNGFVHPGADDSPEPSYEDRNCDGIDGDKTKAIFVSTTGADGNPGTMEQPMRTIQAAVRRASSLNKDVYVAGGTYDEGNGVVMSNGVTAGVFGHYSDGWARPGSPTIVTGSPQAFLLDRNGGVTLQDLTVRGVAANVPGAKTAYGIRAVDSWLTLTKVDVSAGDGVDGARGVDGAQGSDGPQGGAGALGSCDSETVIARGGRGGTGTVWGVDGSNGGTGGHKENGIWFLASDGAYSNIAADPGKGGAEGNPGKRGGDGTPGFYGANGANGLGGADGYDLANVTWSGHNGTDGGAGQNGQGGGGGGGGGAQKGTFVNDGAGNGGGGGGAGGQGGGPGLGGEAGGGSFGLYLFNTTYWAWDVTVTAGNGGRGGDGGGGAGGGIGGQGGPGGAACTSEVGRGGDGGRGGNGGVGGGGGGGAGGPSVAIANLGNTVVKQQYEVRTTAAAGGAGGTGGWGMGQATNGAAGRSAGVLP